MSVLEEFQADVPSTGTSDDSEIYSLKRQMATSIMFSHLIRFSRHEVTGDAQKIPFQENPIRSQKVHDPLLSLFGAVTESASITACRPSPLPGPLPWDADPWEQQERKRGIAFKAVPLPLHLRLYKRR
jgi:hypothetical protein